MSQNPHIFFTAGCWRKHLLMQISKFACFDCYTLKCEVWRTPCAIYYVHNMAHGTASQLWWWSTIWNDDRNQRKQNHIISYHTMPTILLCIYKNISDIFSCNFTKQRRKEAKKAMLCKFQWMEEKKTVSIIRIITVLPVKLQIRVPAAVLRVGWKPNPPRTVAGWERG